MTDRISNIPDFRVTLGDRDLTGAMRPRLVSLTLSEKRGEEADQLDIVLDDSDGQLAIPPEGALLRVALGWKQGRHVQTGLIEKGSFKVDDVSHSGPPDQIRIRARAADFTSDIRNRREQSWKATTLGAVLTEVAGRNGLTARIAPDLAAIALPSAHQSRESDIAFLKRLGRENDAVATVKDGHLLFVRKGAGVTAGGTPLPTITIRRRSGDGHNWQRQKRDGQAGVTASWHDRQAAKRQTVTMGEKDGAKRLRKTYPDEASARRAATAEHDRLKRAPATFDCKLALGRPEIYVDLRATLSGFKTGIDGTWLITEVTHSLDNGSGFTTSVKMELPAERERN